jgi:hypothetical protein
MVGSSLFTLLHILADQTVAERPAGATDQWMRRNAIGHSCLARRVLSQGMGAAALARLPFHI